MWGRGLSFGLSGTASERGINCLTRPRSALPGCPRCTPGDRGADRLLVGFVLVRVLLLSAKHLFLAAKQLFLAAKHAVACMSLPRGQFQRELSARQPGYTLWTVIRWAIMAS